MNRKNIKIEEFNDVVLNREELENKARGLAKSHRVSKKEKSAKSLLYRLDHHYSKISAVYQEVYLNNQNEEVTPPAQWLLDNFYKIEEQVKDIRQNILRERFMKLKVLDGGFLKGVPRVYAIALKLVSYTDGSLDEATLVRFINAYQKQQVLTIAEVWSLSLMIRIALIEKIRIVCEGIHRTEIAWQQASELMQKKPEEIAPYIEDELEKCSSINGLLVERLLRLLRRQDQEGATIINAIEEGLKKYHLNIKELTEDVHHQQATSKITIGNCIISLNLVATIDWNDIFEDMSGVEAILCQDPAGIYEKMDFESRDHYRQQVEKLAKEQQIPEEKVAKDAINRAKKFSGEDLNDSEGHVGHYLLKRERKHLSDYLIPIVFITFVIVGLLVGYSYSYTGRMEILQTLLIIFVVLIPASEIAITFTNRIFTKRYPPDFIPRIEYREGVPEEATTLVVIPTLVPNKERVKELLELLEVYYLANREKNIYFSLAGDFKDSIEQTDSADQEIIDFAFKEVKKLNEKYASNEHLFYYLHRHRQFSETQGKWMGWERKRGALEELNRLLAGDQNTSYSYVSGKFPKGKEIKYVITLDADTYLPMNTAKKLIGMMEHPLNRPVINQHKGIVEKGYGLIQPRIDVSVEGANQSFFTKVFAGQAGIDPYTTASSEVYQDLFGEGIFTGKGIYNLKVVNEVLGHKLPENAILSHDLLEGSYLRTALVSDVQLIDGYPAKYSSFMMRLHRWVRGDWQLIKWLSASTPINALSKWKIFDNLRRSLVSTSQLLVLILGLSLFQGSPLVWVGFGLLSIFIPLILSTVDYIKLKYFTGPRQGMSGNFALGMKSTFYMTMLSLAFLPYQAYMMMDAILRTLHRVFISRKNLLEWVTVADSEKKLRNDASSYIRRMVAVFPVVGVTVLLILLIRPFNIIYGIPLLLLWLISPWIAFRVSHPEVNKMEILEESDLQELRRLARKTWAFYEDLVTEEENYLPPDNIQMYPPKGVAHRTSPTNIGFYLLAVISARDFGYITTGDMVKRTRNTIDTIKKLESWRGHLYNWYDTRSLEVLRPHYVSTVDSGNFVSYLITLKEGLKEYQGRRIIDREMIAGIKDTLIVTDCSSNPKAILLDNLLQQGELSINDYFQVIDEFNSMDWDIEDEEARMEGQIKGLVKEIETYLPILTFLRREPKLMETLDKQKENANGNKLKENTLQFIEALKKIPSPKDLEVIYEKLEENLGKISLKVATAEDRNILELFREKVAVAKGNTSALINDINQLQIEIEELVERSKFQHLYDSKRHLFSIGFQGEEEKLTNSYYDLLASEMRITSYLAIVRREVPQKHWFKLGRALSVVDYQRGLVSWTGTMFEYFMPYLNMKNYENTLLDETYHTVVNAQRIYGEKRNIPWGVSESGYYAFDTMLNYQYKAFGLPDLGLKRGLIEETVISPYSTMLALPIDPRATMGNIHKLIIEGVEGKYGFYEAVDYTAERLPKNKNKEVVQSFMAHHLGMSFVSINNYFHDFIIQKRFHRDPIIRSGELLLQEKMPLRAIVTKEYKERLEERKVTETPLENVVRRYGIPEELPPKVHVLSNGSYDLLLTDGGNGYSKIKDIQITRWREDVLSEGYGTYIFLHNVSNGDTWSATYEPLKKEPDGYQVVFSQDKGKYIRNDENIETVTEVFVSPEDPVEIRKMEITNHGTETVTLQVTSYFETVMTNQSADVAHPAFSNLFVRTELLTDYDSLLASRRPRAHGQTPQWIFHGVLVEGEVVGGLQYETNRGNFIGRGRAISNPLALEHPLKNTTGIAIDPIMSLRRTVRIPSGKTAYITFTTGIEGSKEGVTELVRKYHDSNVINRALDLALTRSQVESTFFNFKPKEIKVFQEMLSQLLFISPLRRKYGELLMENKKGQSGLWAYGISGDLPLLLVTIKRMEDVDIAKETIRAHEYWRSKGITIDLVILNEDESNYLQPLQQALRDIIFSSPSRYLENQRGGIFIKDANVMHHEDRILLYTVARMIVAGEKGTLTKQLQMPMKEKQYPQEKVFHEKKLKFHSKDIPIDVNFFNGYGGFDKDGKEYVIKLKGDLQTPAPWTNVVANENFGFIVTEAGSGFTWAENSRENKITPWSNDPVSDPTGEIIYLRDEDNGEVWNITPLPKRREHSYVIHHGLGYSTFLNHSEGLEQQLTMFVPKDDPVKVNFVTIKNTSGEKRRLSLTYYVNPVMGVSDEMTRQYMVTEINNETGGLLVRNPYQTDFPDRISFVDTSEVIFSYTGDRQEFIGLGGSLKEPAALKREGLSRETGAGLDACLVLQCHIELEANEEKQLVFLLGQEKETSKVNELAKKYRDVNTCREALEEVKNYWRGLFNKIQVKTPDTSMDLMLNAWLLYQTISCRLWARSAFYQSGGAYGYRDQLQDAMNMLDSDPDLVRKQILIHCEHQFIEGDVQHWWHPGAGEKGIRTRFSDDLLWLPYATAEYYQHTQDEALLHEVRHFLEEEPLREGEDERYGIPKISEEKSSVYDHCCRAIEQSLKYGVHGIPLMGSGDWNDGMSTVGNQGKGESIWLGWFLHRILKKFSQICYLLKDEERGDRYLKVADEIVANIDEHAWDGEWYIRAFYDDGSPLGSSENTECMIDSLGQSWSIISREEENERSRVAMKAVEDYLIKKDEGLILLFTPPFDESDQEPGYIKGYVPGVRENGGQYTHAASWVVKGFAQLKDGDKAWQLYNMINPINHTRTDLECATYKVEPYVMAADVYAVAPHVGRGGWTWYTGVAGWMYSVGLQDILGIKKRGNKLFIVPCIPRDWTCFEVNYNHNNTQYHIAVKNPFGVTHGIRRIMLDGGNIKEDYINLVEDGKSHWVEVILGEKE
ncbi:GH36-type glycosyl hydrolase domain-containing protein [Alkaliphilus hydrothermalis]|uniref:GH36-type glycosyl hydrolase domain-containing protein n=1 Tax=Alkaliphilus hydrothermalis TaxID=1482730 RepID=UPI001FAF6CAF|nr:glucoamylase family protein [Alkaliphilus hydrothermalis]